MHLVGFTIETLHKDVWGSEFVAPQTRKLDTRWRIVISTPSPFRRHQDQFPLLTG